MASTKIDVDEVARAIGGEIRRSYFGIIVQWDDNMRLSRVPYDDRRKIMAKAVEYAGEIIRQTAGSLPKPELYNWEDGHG